jgi:hypothetical protein
VLLAQAERSPGPGNSERETPPHDKQTCKEQTICGSALGSDKGTPAYLGEKENAAEVKEEGQSGEKN